LLGSGEDLRLGEIRGHDRRQREQPCDQRLHGVVLQKPRAGAGDHHGVDDERDRMVDQEVCDGLDQGPREQHPGLRRVDADVVEHGLELRTDEFGRQLVDRRHTGRVLRRERDERRCAVATGGREGLQVGLNPGAATGIGRRDRQTTWCQFTPFAGITRIRFAGVISALAGTPVSPG
jgi:hypothetical protein